MPEPKASQKFFTRASQSFGSALVVHEHARDELLKRLEYLTVNVETAVDAGCGIEPVFEKLAERWPSAWLLGIDRNFSMCRAASKLCQSSQMAVLRGCVEHLPLRSQSVDIVFANMLMPWCLPDSIFNEVARVLKPTGVFLFATLGPDTLCEVRRAWAAADDAVHVHAAFDMHDLGDQAMAAGLMEPVLDREHLTLTYGNLRSLARDLRNCGAVNSAAGRRKSLTGKGRWRVFEHALLESARSGRFAVSVELIYGHAWGHAVSRSRSNAGPSEALIPLSQIKRR